MIVGDSSWPRTLDVRLAWDIMPGKGEWIMIAELEGVTLTLKANIYFDGGVVSHTITAPGQPRRTVGVIRKGSYTFNTSTAERMEIIAGACCVRQDGEADGKHYRSGSFFNVPANSSFEIVVENGVAEYLCTYG